MLRGTLCLLGFIILAGCNGSSVGQTCEVSVECSPDAVCQTGARFPGGYCTIGCDTNEDCPGGSVCTEEEGGVCLLSCTSDGECRSGEGYACVMVEARGAGG